jgi:hypothetical protein
VKIDDASREGPFFKKSFEIFAFDAFKTCKFAMMVPMAIGLDKIESE